MVVDNTLAWVHNRKAVLMNDRLRWLQILEMFYKQYKEKPSQELMEMMKFCGEQSQEIKKELSKIK